MLHADKREKKGKSFIHLKGEKKERDDNLYHASEERKGKMIEQFQQPNLKKGRSEPR